MKKSWIIIAVAVLVLIPIGIWWSSPEQVVIRRTKHLMDVLTITSGTSSPFRQAKVFSMNALLQPNVEIVTPEISDSNGTFDKQEIESAFSWICKQAKESEFLVTDVQDLEIDGDRAVINVLVKGFRQPPRYRPEDDTHDVEITWEKTGDGWRYSRVVWKTR